MTKNKNKLEAFLSKAEEEDRKARCPCCRDEHLASIISDFLDKKERGETSVSLCYLYENFLLPDVPGTPKAAETVYKHVRKCLLRDVKTGRRLNAKE